MTVTIAGAGMAGLVAAARLRELGLASAILEKGDRPGGSMLLSSGVIWRHRTVEDFRRECPGGDAELQALVFEQLDERLDWLESLGATATARDTPNPRTTGRRFSPAGLVAALQRKAGDVRLGEPLGELGDEPVVLATGGFGAAFARRLSLPLRASPWSEGDGFDLARRRGAAPTRGMDEFYGRALPAPPARVGEADFVGLAQVYGRYALVLDETGAAIASAPCAWHENDLVQAIARRPGGRAWYLVAEETLDLAAGDVTVRERIEAARAAGGRSFPRRSSRFRCRPGTCWPCTSPHRSRTRSAASRSTVERASSTKGATRSKASTRPVPTWAASRPAATRAASRPRSCSGASPRSP